MASSTFRRGADWPRCMRRRSPGRARPSVGRPRPAGRLLSPMQSHTPPWHTCSRPSGAPPEPGIRRRPLSSQPSGQAGKLRPPAREAGLHRRRIRWCVGPRHLRSEADAPGSRGCGLPRPARMRRSGPWHPWLGTAPWQRQPALPGRALRVRLRPRSHDYGHGYQHQCSGSGHRCPQGPWREFVGKKPG